MSNRRMILFLLIIIVILFGGFALISAQTFSPPDITVAIPSVSRTCTAFCLDNSGYAVFGANMDNYDLDGLLVVNKRGVSKTGWETSLNGDVARWSSTYGSVTFDLGAYQLPWAGMNEAGLMISALGLPGRWSPDPDADDRPPLMWGLWMQYVLDTCATIDDVLATAQQVQISTEYGDESSGHHLVCDRTASCAVLEFLDNEMIVYTGTELPISALANSKYARSLEVWQERPSLITDTADSLSRFKIAANWARDFTPREAADAVNYAFSILNAVSVSYATRWSVVFDAENLAVHFRTWNHSPIRSLSFDDLDFSCQTPVRMTHIKAELEGNIVDDLIDYDHDLSLTYTLDFLKIERTPITGSEVRLLLEMVESFPCEE